MYHIPRASLKIVQEVVSASSRTLDILFTHRLPDMFMCVRYLGITVRVSAVSSPEKLTTFFRSSLSLLFISLVHSGVAHYFRYAKKCRSSCGGPFLWGPCSAEHAEHA